MEGLQNISRVLFAITPLLLSCVDSGGDKSASDGGDTATASAAIGTDRDAGDSGDWPDGKDITIEAVYTRVRDGDSEMLLLNVVDEQFYDLGHIEGSLKITWDVLADNLDRVDPARHIVVYCRRGVRSESAYTTLIENDYPFVWVMEGGIEAWTAAGYPTVAE